MSGRDSGCPTADRMREAVDSAEALCKRWMPGVRDGSGRMAWEHPADLVRLLSLEMPQGHADALERSARNVLGWCHDLLEDGVREDGVRVRAHDLVDGGIPDKIVAEVCLLTNTHEDKARYLASLKTAPPRVRLVKVGDRVCNLREGAKSFDARRWVRYVGEALYFVYPLADDLGVEGRWLQQELLAAGAPERP